VQLSGVTEWLVLNIATWIVIHTYKFWTTNKTLLPLCIFISWNAWHPLVEPSLRSSALVDAHHWVIQVINFLCCSLIKCTVSSKVWLNIWEWEMHTLFITMGRNYGLFFLTVAAPTVFHSAHNSMYSYLLNCFIIPWYISCCLKLLKCETTSNQVPHPTLLDPFHPLRANIYCCPIRNIPPFNIPQEWQAVSRWHPQQDKVHRLLLKTGTQCNAQLNCVWPNTITPFTNAGS
jgi:hypothetical protein